MATEKKIVTRFDEVHRIVDAETINSAVGMYLTKPAYRTWKEERFDTAEKKSVEVERKETIIAKGVMVTKDDIPRLLFHFQSGELQYIEVSNLRRSATECGHHHMVAMVSAIVKNKTVRLIMHTLNMKMALEIARDYIEQHYKDSFEMTQAKVATSYHIIEETLLQLQDCTDERAIENEIENSRYYEISARVARWCTGDQEPPLIEGIFLVRTSDVDVAKEVISRYLLKHEEAREPEKEHHVNVIIDEAKICNYTKVLPYEFSSPYIKDYLRAKAKNDYSDKKITYDEMMKELERIDKMRDK